LPTPVQVGRHDIVISRTEKPYSYECGKAGNRHTIKYGDFKELKDHITALKNMGLIDEDITIASE
jgi:hypothetical protein